MRMGDFIPQFVEFDAVFVELIKNNYLLYVRTFEFSFPVLDCGQRHCYEERSTDLFYLE